MQIMEALKCNAFQIPSLLLSTLSSERARSVYKTRASVLVDLFVITGGLEN